MILRAEDSTVPMPIRMRAALMNALIKEIKTWTCDAEETAYKLNTTELRLSHLLDRQFEKFSIESLVKMCPRAGINVVYHLEGLE